MKTGIELIAEERKRQIEVEGWVPDHDDDNDLEELAAAAACYAMPRDVRKCTLSGRGGSIIDWLWPWASEWWKPGRSTVDGRIRDCVKAGALLAAEIDRWQRIKAVAAEAQGTTEVSSPNNMVSGAGASPRTTQPTGSATGSFPNASNNLPDDPARKRMQ